MHQILFRLGLRPRPYWGSLQCSPGPVAGFKGPTSKGREKREGRGDLPLSLGKGNEGRKKRGRKERRGQVGQGRAREGRGCEERGERKGVRFFFSADLATLWGRHQSPVFRIQQFSSYDLSPFWPGTITKYADWGVRHSVVSSHRTFSMERKEAHTSQACDKRFTRYYQHQKRIQQQHIYTNNNSYDRMAQCNAICFQKSNFTSLNCE